VSPDGSPTWACQSVGTTRKQKSDVPRYATPAGAHAASEARERAQRLAAESASGNRTFTVDGVTIALDLFGLVTPLPGDGGPVPGEIIEHQAHAIGHAAVLLADCGVLLAGDMLVRSGLVRTLRRR